MPDPHRRTFSLEPIDWENLEDSAKKDGFESRNKLIQSLVKSYLTGDTKNQEATIKQKIEIAKWNLLVEKLKTQKAETRIKKAYADYVEEYKRTFGSFPTPRGFKALAIKAKKDEEEEPKFLKPEYVPKFFINKFSDSTFMGICKICDITFDGVYPQNIEKDLEEHIREAHKQDPYQRVL